MRARPLKAGAASSEAYALVTATDADLSEGWFQDAIAHNTEIVIGPCRRAGITGENWFFWSREVGVADEDGKGIWGGIDVLLVSETGRVGIVETKLSYNPERRRSVIAQVLGYALNLTEQDLYGLVDSLPTVDGRLSVDPDAVGQRPRDGDHLLIVAGDVLDPRAVRLGHSMLGDPPVAIMGPRHGEHGPLQTHGQRSRASLVDGATLRGTLGAETRQVTVEGLPERATARMSPSPARPATDSRRANWNERKFRDAFGTAPTPDGFNELGKRLRDLPNRFPQAVVAFGTATAADGAPFLRLNGHSRLEYQMKGMLRCRCRPRRIRKALSEELAETYLETLFEIAGFTHEAYPWAPATRVASKTDELIDLLKKRSLRCQGHSLPEARGYGPRPHCRERKQPGPDELGPVERTRAERECLQSIRSTMTGLRDLMACRPFSRAPDL